jgi:hypothetical protein
MSGSSPTLPRFSSELPTRRTREPKHLRYAVNRRVPASNPA